MIFLIHNSRKIARSSTMENTLSSLITICQSKYPLIGWTAVIWINNHPQWESNEGSCHYATIHNEKSPEWNFKNIRYHTVK